MKLADEGADANLTDLAATWWSPRTMTVPLLTLMVLLVAFTAEVGWLCRA